MGLSQYYYLVSSLPDLVADAHKGVLSFSDLLNDLTSMVDAHDRPLVRAMRLPFDNTNIVQMLHTSPVLSFDTRGNYSHAELLAGFKNPQQLEWNYQYHFLTAYKEEKSLLNQQNWETQLAWLFYEEMCDHQNEFIRRWYDFDVSLRNIVSAINITKYGKNEDLEPSIILHNNEVSSHILKSSAADFGLSGRFPWLEHAISLRNSNITEYDTFFDNLRFDFLDNQMVIAGFSIDAILAFCGKSAISERWSKLDAQSGKEAFNLLVAEVENGFTLSAQTCKSGAKE